MTARNRRGHTRPRLRLPPIAVIVLLSCAWAQAQDYRFRVPEARCDVLIEKSGKLVIKYAFTFHCSAGARAIDVVDVGMPTRSYKVLRAAVDGRQVAGWRPSKYIEIGPEVPLGASQIKPGQTAVFTLEAEIEPGLVWQDTTDREYASFQFFPTYFGSQFVQGKTRLILSYILPKDVSLETVRWQSDADRWDVKGVRDDVDGRPFAGWIREVRLTGPHRFGISFPKKHVAKVEHMTIWRLFVMWWRGSPEAQLASGVAYAIVFAVFFLLMSRGTGWSLLLVILGVGGFLFYKHPILHLGMWLFIPCWIALWYFGVHRKKQKYFEAELTVEGGGIKRGLTAVEAAVVLEAPLERVLSMVIFGLLQKQVIAVTREDPLEVRLNGEREDKVIVKRPDGKRVKIHPYEVEFLDRIETSRGELKRINFSKATETLVGLVKYKMAGFDLNRTREYYGRIVSRAWNKAKDTINLPEQENAVDKYFNWMYLDDDFGGRWRDIERRGVPYRPYWFGYGRAPAGPSAPSPVSGPEPVVSFKDVAHSLVTRTENVSNALLGSVDSFTQAGEGVKGLMDLSGVDHFTADVLSELASSRGGGGGGFGGGCACAGCACACACAGGGR